MLQRPSLEPSFVRKLWAPALGAPVLDDAPLRAELFTVGQLERHARTIAGWHELASASAHDDWLLARLRDCRGW
ncbi:MAG: hypothetical protein NT062_23940 [Proteobacteria bacterium]|nr:hypothetical protein [Pseudomonadota bacterium]